MQPLLTQTTRQLPKQTTSQIDSYMMCRCLPKQLPSQNAAYTTSNCQLESRSHLARAKHNLEAKVQLEHDETAACPNSYQNKTPRAKSKRRGSHLPNRSAAFKYTCPSGYQIKVPLPKERKYHLQKQKPPAQSSPLLHNVQGNRYLPKQLPIQNTACTCSNIVQIQMKQHQAANCKSRSHLAKSKRKAQPFKRNSNSCMM